MGDDFDPSDFGLDGPGGFYDELGSQCWFLATEDPELFITNIEFIPADVCEQIQHIPPLVERLEQDGLIGFNPDAGNVDAVGVLVAMAKRITSVAERSDVGAEDLREIAGNAEELRTIVSDFDSDFPAQTRRELGSTHLIVTWLERLAEEAALAPHRMFCPAGDDLFFVRTGAADRKIIERALERVRNAGSTDDPNTVRLFPAPYADDAEKNAGWDAMTKGELIDSRFQARQEAAAIGGAATATGDQLHALMRCLNDARLMLGTELEITDDDRAEFSLRHPVAFAEFRRLGHLVWMLTSAMQTTL